MLHPELPHGLIHRTLVGITIRRAAPSSGSGAETSYASDLFLAGAFLALHSYRFSGPIWW